MTETPAGPESPLPRVREASDRTVPPPSEASATRAKNRSRRTSSMPSRPASIASADTSTHTCPGSWENCSAANSLKPLKVIVVPSSRASDCPSARFAAPTRWRVPRSICVLSSE